MVEDDVGAEALAGARARHRRSCRSSTRPSLCWSLRQAPTSLPGRPSTDGSRYSMTKVRTGVCSTMSAKSLSSISAMPPPGWRCGEIAAKQRILLLGGPRLARADLEVGVAAEQLALGRAGFELGGEHADRNAGRAIDAAWAIGDRLAAAEADPAERLVQFAGMAAVKLGEDLPLDLARQVRARARVRHEEFRKAEWCAHPRTSLNWLLNSLCGW